MLKVLVSSWAILFGLGLLMIGNGMQSTLLGIRGGIEGFSTLEMSIVMSGYFAGFLFASRTVPEMIRRVGHLRVFAALGSFISATLILYPSIADPWVWTALRVLIGFCFCGVYIVVESWLNAASTNETRGKALSLYMIVQMLGVIVAQGIVTLGEPSGFVVFIVPSVLVSIAFAPILLSATPTPSFQTTKAMSLGSLWRTSPLGCVSVFLMGGVFAGQFGMSPVYGSEAGFSVAEISAFVAAIYVGGLVFQYPIGWLSDRMDRRKLIMLVAFACGLVSLAAASVADNPTLLLPLAVAFGGLSNPLYPLAIAYTNDMLEPDDMASASAGLLFLNGVGAVAGPLVIGWAMGAVGPAGFWLFLAALLLLLGVYAIWRMLRRPVTPGSDGNVTYAPVPPSATPVAMELAQEVYAEAREDAERQK